MSQRIRRSLAVGLLAVLSLALPAPSQAAGLWESVVPTVWVARAWSWLESLGLVPPATAAPRRPSAQREKSGTANPGDAALQPSPTAPQGSGIDPNGGK